MGTPVKPKAMLSLKAQENAKEKKAICDIQSKYLSKKSNETKPAITKELEKREKLQSPGGITRKLQNVNSALTKDAIPTTVKESLKITKNIKTKSLNPAKSNIPIPTTSTQCNASAAKPKFLRLNSTNEIRRDFVRNKLPRLVDSEENTSSSKTQESDNNILQKKESTESESLGSVNRSKPNLQEEFQNIIKYVQANASGEKKEVLEAKKEQLTQMYYGIASLLPDKVNEESLINAGAMYIKSLKESKTGGDSKSKSNSKRETIKDDEKIETGKVEAENDLKSSVSPPSLVEGNIDNASKVMNVQKSLDKKAYNKHENSSHRKGGGGCINKNKKNKLENSSFPLNDLNTNENICDDIVQSESPDHTTQNPESKKKCCVLGLLKKGKAKNSKDKKLTAKELQSKNLKAYEDFKNECECLDHQECFSDNEQLDNDPSVRAPKTPLSPVYEENSSDIQSSPTRENFNRQHGEKRALRCKEGRKASYCPKSCENPSTAICDSITSIENASDHQSFSTNKTISSVTFSKSKEVLLSIDDLESKYKNSNITEYEDTEANIDTDHYCREEKLKVRREKSNVQQEKPSKANATVNKCSRAIDNINNSPKRVNNCNKDLQRSNTKEPSFIKFSSSLFNELHNKPIYQSGEVCGNSSFVWNNEKVLHEETRPCESKENFATDYLLQQSLAETRPTHFQNISETDKKGVTSKGNCSNRKETVETKKGEGSEKKCSEESLMGSNFQKIISILDDLQVETTHSFLPQTSDNKTSIAKKCNLTEGSRSKAIEKEIFDSYTESSKQEDDDVKEPTASSNVTVEEQKPMSAENWMKAFILRMSQTYALPSNDQQNSTQLAISKNETSATKDQIHSKANKDSDLCSYESDTQVLIKQIECNLEQIRVGLMELCKTCDDEMKKSSKKRPRCVTMPVRRKLSFTKLTDIQPSSNINPESNTCCEECPTSTQRHVQTPGLNDVNTVNASSNYKCLEKDEPEIGWSEITSNDKRVSWDSAYSVIQPMELCSEKEAVVLEPSEQDFTETDQTMDQLVVKESDVIRYIYSLNVLENIENKNAMPEVSLVIDQEDSQTNITEYTGCPCMNTTYMNILEQFQESAMEFQ